MCPDYVTLHQNNARGGWTEYGWMGVDATLTLEEREREKESRPWLVGVCGSM